jgi:hypothetical protein
MKTFDLLDLAVRNIRESMLRNVLTTVGIGVGVASLVSMLSLGIGLQELASSRMNQSGLFDTVMVTSKRGQQLDRRPGPPLGGEVESEPEDAPVLDEAARRELAGIPEVLEVYPEIRFAAEAQFEGKTFRRAVLSVPSSARETESFRGVHGTFFSSEIAPEALLQDNFAAELLGWKPRGRGMQREAGKPPVAVDLDDRVHATDRLVIELEVRRWHLAELDDRQAQPLLADELVALEDAERQRCFCAGHEFLPVERLLLRVAGDDIRAAVESSTATPCRYRSSAD